MSKLTRIAIATAVALVLASVALLATKAHTPPVTEGAAPAPAARRDQPAAAVAGTARSVIESSVAEKATIRGRIVDASGAPIPGARVYHGQASEPALNRPGAPKNVRGETISTETDETGAFVLAGLPAGRLVRLKVEADSYLPEVIDVDIPLDAREADAGTTSLGRGRWAEKLGDGPAGKTGINDQASDGKVYVTKVQAGSPAARAGVAVGDEILAVDGQPVGGLGRRARSYLLLGKPGTTVKISVKDRSGGVREMALVRAASGSKAPGWPYVDPE